MSYASGGMLPHTHYAKNGSISVAYQALGPGPLDLVHIPGRLY
jgi:hypothetical protein